MTHVRLPTLGECLMSRFADAATMRAAISDLQRAVDGLLRLDFAVSVDMHPGGEFAQLYRTDAEAAYSALADGWRRLARTLRALPADRVFGELLNEPPTDDSVWRPHAARLARELRSELPATTFIVEPAPFQRVEALAAWRPLDDANIVYAFHYYDPMAFTHQGLTWDRGSPLARLEGVPFPASRDDPSTLRLLERLRASGETELAQSIDRALETPWNRRAIDNQFAPLADWSRKHGAPVILNEFGVLRLKAERAARLEWLRDVREAAEARGFGWTHWEYGQAFGFLDAAGHPDLALIDALLPA
jgi:endoglucanase